MSKVMDGLFNKSSDKNECLSESTRLGKVEAMTRMDISDTNFQDLEKLSPFTNLRDLILDKNELCDSHIKALPVLLRLKALSLNKNKISDLDQLLIILKKRCPSLTYLSLLGNPACPDQLTCAEKTEDDYRRYRLYVLYNLPKLNCLDSSMLLLCDKQQAQIQGPFLKTIRPKAEFIGQIKQEETPFDLGWLPSEKIPTTKPSFNKKRYAYSGKHSEGNRFIRNKDL